MGSNLAGSKSDLTLTVTRIDGYKKWMYDQISVCTGVDFADEKWLRFTAHHEYAWENNMPHIMP